MHLYLARNFKTTQFDHLSECEAKIFCTMYNDTVYFIYPWSPFNKCCTFLFRKTRQNIQEFQHVALLKTAQCCNTTSDSSSSFAFLQS